MDFSSHGLLHSPHLFLHRPSTHGKKPFPALSPFCPFVSPLSALPSLLSLLSGLRGEPWVSVFLYIDPFIFNGPMFPRVGAILCGFRWAGDAVRPCCHSVLLRAKAHDLGSALTAIPRRCGRVHQPLVPRER